MGREQFDNTVKTEWLEDDSRSMRLLEPVRFTDSKGVIWTAHAYSIINGADIPRWLWGLVGSPYVGYHRRPSVIHDEYCKSHLRPAQAVHDCWKEMLIAEGMSKDEVKLLYDAVNRYGPRW